MIKIPRIDWRAITALGTVALVLVASLDLWFSETRPAPTSLDSSVREEAGDQSYPKAQNSDWEVPTEVFEDTTAADTKSIATKSPAEIGISASSKSASPQQSDYTRWQEKTLRFDRSPESIKPCKNEANISVKFDAINKTLLINGEPLTDGQPRSLSDTCVILNAQVNDPRSRHSGGTLSIKYREKR